MNEKLKAGPPGAQTPAPRRKHRFLLAAGIVLAALVLLAALAPTILSMGVFRGTILAQAGSALPAHLAADGLSLSWFGSQEVRGLSVDTADGSPVARADRVALQQGVFALLLDRSRIGAVTIEGAEVWPSGIAKLREAIAARQKAAPPKPPGKPPSLPAAVHLANVTVHSGKTDLTLVKADFHADEAADTDHLEAAWEATASAERGQGTLDLRVKNLRTNWDALDISGSLDLGQLPVAMACALAADLGAEVSGTGALSGKMEFHRDAAGGLSANVSCTGNRVVITGKALNNDRLTLEALLLEANVAYGGNKLTVTKFDLESPLANAHARGDLTLASARGEPPTGNLSAGLGVSLAPLAAMLPNTLGLQKDIKIESGQLAATFQVSSDEKTASLRLAADVKDLRGRRDGKAVALPQVRVEADADRERPAPAAAGAPPPDALAILRAVRVNKLQVSAPFGSIQAAGRLEAFTLDANLDLTDTTEKVGQFIDLGGRTAQGAARVHVETRGDLDKGVQLTGTLDLADVRLALGAGRTWQEPKAAAAVEAAATFTQEHELATLAVSKLDVDASTAKVSGTWNLQRLPDGGWGYGGDVSGAGQIARAASLADVVLAVAGGAPRSPGAGGMPTPPLRGHASGASATMPSEKHAGHATPDEAATAEGVDTGQLLADLLQRAARAEGQWSLRARVQNPDGKNLGLALGAQLANLAIALGPQDAAPVQISTLAASGAAQQAAGGPWNISLASLAVTAPDLSLTAAAEAGVPVGPDAKPPTLKSASITAAGSVLRTLGLADSVLAFVAAAEPKRAADAKEGSGLESAQEFIHQLAAAATPPTGNWKLQAQAATAAGQGLSGNFTAQVSDAALLLDPKHAGPLHIVSASVSGTAAQPEGGPWHFVVTDGRLTTPEVNLAARADVTLPADFNVGALAGTAAAQANVSLAATSKTLRSFGLMPEGTDAAGSAAFRLTVESQDGRNVQAGVMVQAADPAFAWAKDRRIAQPKLDGSLTAAVVRDAKGAVSEINIDHYRIETPAGAVEGSARLTPAGETWAYHVAAEGAGDIQQLAQVVAGATGGKPSAIRGQWKVKGAFDQAAAQSISVVATATDLVVPPETAAGAKTALRLADVNIDAAAAIAAGGAIDITRATITGPGLAARAAGSVRLPKDKAEKVAADGAVSLKADLAELAKLLQPFGLLPAQSVLAGAAEVTGKVASGAAGVRGSGTLAVTGLDVALPEAGIALKEPQVVVPLTVEYASAERRWTAALTGISSALVKGDASGSYTEPASPSVVRGEWNLAFDGERLTAALGKNLPQGLRLAGAWGASGRISGPLPSGPQPWNQKLAGLAGDGAVEAAAFQYNKLSGGKGTVRWRLEGGELLLGDPAQPSQLALAGGRLNLAARVDLKGPAARVIIPRPLRLVEGVPLSDPAVRDYLKFSVPLLLEGDVGSEGHVSVVIDSLDLPLAEAELGKAAGSGSFTIDRFHSKLGGVLAALLASGGAATETKAPSQTLGPVAVRLQNSIFTMQQHDLVMNDNSVLKFQGWAGLDRSLNASVEVPINVAALRKFGMSERDAQPFQNQRVLVGVTGTIDKPRTDDQAFWKRVGEIGIEYAKRRAIEEIGNRLKDSLLPRRK
jgi:hypothetical protein